MVMDCFDHAIAAFVGRASKLHEPGRNTLLECILCVTWDFRRILIDEKIDVQGKYYKQVERDILEWVADKKYLPGRWGSCWSSFFYNLGYRENYDKYADPENEDFQRVRACAAAYLEQIDTTTAQAEETRCAVLRMHRNKELDRQITPVLNLRELQLEDFTANDCRQFCYYGYMMGVRAERKRRRRTASN